MFARAKVCRVDCLLVCFVLLACGWPQPSFAAPKAKPADKKSKKEQKPTAEEVTNPPILDRTQVPTVDFVPSVSTDGPTTIDQDETPEGIERLKEIQNHTKGFYHEIKALVDQRRPLALRRDPLLVQDFQALQVIAADESIIPDLEADMKMAEFHLQLAVGNEAAQLRTQITALRNRIGQLTGEINRQRAGINARDPQIVALNNEIRPLEARLQKLFVQTCEARKQWVEIRQPLEKYTRGDYELLRKVLDDWILIDGLWPGAHFWAALCAYELGDYAAAWNYADKAIRIYEEWFGPLRTCPQGEAVKGLVLTKTARKAGPANDALADAFRHASDFEDWQAHFLIGRAYMAKEATHSQAYRNFEKALEIQPNSLSAKLWQARLQTTTTMTKIRDVEVGVKALEQLWKDSGQRSWRVASFLAEAYQAAGHPDAANAMLETALKLAPTKQQEGIRNDFAESSEKLNSPKKTKPASTKRTSRD